MMEGNKMAGAVHAGIETAGLLDIDSELVLVFSNGAQVQFDFKSRVNIKEICSNISDFIL